MIRTSHFQHPGITIDISETGAYVKGDVLQSKKSIN